MVAMAEKGLQVAVPVELAVLVVGLETASYKQAVEPLAIKTLPYKKRLSFLHCLFPMNFSSDICVYERFRVFL